MITRSPTRHQATFTAPEATFEAPAGLSLTHSEDTEAFKVGDRVYQKGWPHLTAVGSIEVLPCPQDPEMNAFGTVVQVLPTGSLLVLWDGSWIPFLVKPGKAFLHPDLESAIGKQATWFDHQGNRKKGTVQSVTNFQYTILCADGVTIEMPYHHAIFYAFRLV